MTRQAFIRDYLFGLILRYEKLEEERQALLSAATRITAIQAEKQELIADAQDALAKFNSVYGTDYTLAQVRAWYDRNVGTINIPPTEEAP